MVMPRGWFVPTSGYVLMFISNSALVMGTDIRLFINTGVNLVGTFSNARRCSGSPRRKGVPRECLSVGEGRPLHCEDSGDVPVYPAG